jgi:hypothetical protein
MASGSMAMLRRLHKPLISRIGVSDTVTRLRLNQFAFSRNALMLFICAFNAISELAPIVGELFGHFVNPAWHIATDCGPEDHALTDMEFMRHHGAPSRMGVSVARPLSVSVYAPLSRLCAMNPRMAMDCIVDR